MARAGSEKEGWGERLTRGAPLAVFIGVALFIAYRLLFVLELIAIALLVALLLRSVVDWLEQYGIRPWMSSILLVLALVAAGGFVWFIVVPNILGEIEKLFSTASGALNEAERQASQEEGVLSFLPGLTAVTNQIQSYVTGLQSKIPQITAEVFQVALDVVAALFVAVFVAVYPGTPVKGVLLVTPRRHHAKMKNFLGKLATRLRGWMVGAGVAMLFVGVTASVGLWLIGIPLYLTFGIVAGLLNIIPFLGSILGGLLPVLIALTISPVKALLVLALFLAINQIEGNVVQPLVMGNQAELDPVLVLLSFLIVGALLGPAGLLLAVPAVILLKTTFEYTVLDRSSAEPEEPGMQENRGDP